MIKINIVSVGKYLEDANGNRVHIEKLRYLGYDKCDCCNYHGHFEYNKKKSRKDKKAHQFPNGKH